MSVPWPWIIFGAIVIAFLVIRRAALITEKAAREYLRQGAIVIDVRTPKEFQSGHVPGAVNLPLAELPAHATARFPDKEQVLLVHCLGGGRSAVAQRQLKAKGYKRVFNAGSYRRAGRIAQSDGPGAARSGAGQRMPP
jgi:phage shock protein E